MASFLVRQLLESCSCNNLRRQPALEGREIYMNVDPRNAADTPFEVHDALQHAHSVDWQPDELSAQTGAPAHSSEDQESFKQQLTDLDLDDSDSV